MPELIDRQSHLWQYLPSEQRELIEDGEALLADAAKHPKTLTDYSYLVFPVAKMYEGFLKKLFLDLGLISQSQYESDHFRIGKALNPNLEEHLRIESIYDKVCSHFESSIIADALWQAWKRGRNALFHYFPGRVQRINFTEANEVIQTFLKAMDLAIEHNRTFDHPIHLTGSNN